MEQIDEREENKQELKKELVKIAKKHTLRKKLISSIIIIAVFLVSILSAWLIGSLSTKNEAQAAAQAQIEKLEEALKEKEAKINEIIDTPIVVSHLAPEIALDIISAELNSIGELATVEYAFTDAAIFSDSKQVEKWGWVIPGTTKSFITKWDGKIKAGVKIDQIQVSVDESEYKILITLPAAEILSYEIYNAETLDEKNNVFNPISVDDKIQFDAKTEEAMKERAVENGLLDMAQKNAEGIIASLLCVNPDITSSYTIEFVKE